MCMLWQRFGRAACDLALDTITILFVESSCTDANKEQKEARHEKREAAKMKRKADEEWVQGGAAKRLAARRELSSREGLNVRSEHSVGDEGDCRIDVGALFHDRYLQKDQTQPKRKVGGEVEPAMDDFINAAHRDAIQCYRQPAKWFFDFDKTGELISVYVRSAQEFTYLQPPITCNAIQIFLLVAQDASFEHPPSAMSSVHQLSLKI